MEVSFEAEDFELDFTATMVSNGLLEEKDYDKVIDKLDELTDKLEDSADQVKDLKSKISKLKNGGEKIKKRRRLPVSGTVPGQCSTRTGGTG